MNTTLSATVAPASTAPAENDRSSRLGGLRRFAIAITLLNLIGRLFLGFEQSWLQLFTAIAAAYSMELGLELLFAWAERRRPRFLGGWRTLADFLLSAHIAAFAVSMLIYASDRLAPYAFAAAVAIGSKALLRVTIGQGSRHFLNPSNFGITVTLLCFSWVSVAQPYHFTENLSGFADWVLPLLIICTGTLLNARFTGRLPLIAAWLSAFVLQAALRSLVFGLPLLPALAPMTGVAFILFTFYMITDPATTPACTRNQILFGAAVACVYGLLVAVHVSFDLFFALTTVCLARGAAIAVENRLRRRGEAQQPAALAVAGGPK
ncbi:MAG TPA: hypothetical protein VFS21_15715 [Roseiflexaceae bacterium]|nr:hypothetical protein [Roseiflexaceae bacterium]